MANGFEYQSGTRTDIGQIGSFESDMEEIRRANEAERKRREIEEKKECKARGGKWVNGACVLPLAEQIQEDMKNTDWTAPPAKTSRGFATAESKTPEVITDESGKITGVTIGGKSFFPLKPSEVKSIITKYQAKTTLPEGTQPLGTAQRQAERAQRIAQLRQMGVSETELAAIQAAPKDWGQALTAGVANIPSILSRTAAGAGAGALAGGVAGLGIGAIPGAIIGGIGGFISAIWSGTQSNIKSQQRGEIGAAQDVLSSAKSNLRQIRMIAQQDPSKAEEALEMYYAQVVQVQKAHRKVQLETQGNLNKFMEDGTDILSDFELFLMPGGYADLQRMRLEEAIISGQPATPEEIMQFYQEEYGDLE